MILPNFRWITWKIPLGQWVSDTCLAEVSHEITERCFGNLNQYDHVSWTGKGWSEYSVDHTSSCLSHIHRFAFLRPTFLRFTLLHPPPRFTLLPCLTFEIIRFRRLMLQHDSRLFVGIHLFSEIERCHQTKSAEIKRFPKPKQKKKSKRAFECRYGYVVIFIECFIVRCNKITIWNWFHSLSQYSSSSHLSV